mgnify:CR=1 FL=1
MLGCAIVLLSFCESNTSWNAVIAAWNYYIFHGKGPISCKSMLMGWMDIVVLKKCCNVVISIWVFEDMKEIFVASIYLKFWVL